jgi:hypothetical protein
LKQRETAARGREAIRKGSPGHFEAQLPGLEEDRDVRCPQAKQSLRVGYTKQHTKYITFARKSSRLPSNFG